VLDNKFLASNWILENQLPIKCEIEHKPDRNTLPKSLTNKTFCQTKKSKSTKLYLTTTGSKEKYINRLSSHLNFTSQLSEIPELLIKSFADNCHKIMYNNSQRLGGNL
jgi:hypothetical protein